MFRNMIRILILKKKHKKTGQKARILLTLIVYVSFYKEPPNLSE